MKIKVQVWLLLLVCWLPLRSPAEGISWLRDDRAAFAEARERDAFVILYLEAVWCHWCHVMDEQTYGDPRVRTLLEKHYVTLRIDQDLRPDLANRYRDYGWPATVVLAADGTEIVKRRGYMPPDGFARLLQAIVDDPSPENLAKLEPTVPAVASGLSAEVREELLARHRRTFDPTHGGLRGAMKFMDRDQVEYLLWQSAQGDAEATSRVRVALDGAAKLLDPVWGGVYQYSTGGNWDHPHFEKLTRLQGEYLRVIALACGQLQVARDCESARSILRYLRRFQQDAHGSYYTAQDADLRPGEHSAAYFKLADAERLALGTPRVDTHVYARENGMVIEGLASWHEAVGDPQALAEAQRAAQRMLDIRNLPGGGFRHDEHDRAGPYLADTLAMGRAFLALYRADGARHWLEHAMAATDFIEARFRAPVAYLSAVQGTAPIAPVPHLDEVLSLTRFCHLLSQYSGRAQDQDCARHGLAWMAHASIALSRSTDAGILLAAEEQSREPLHLTIRGARGDALAAELFAAAQRIPAWYKRLDWWDDEEGPLPNANVSYPKLKSSAAYFCTADTCSLPLRTAAAIREFHMNASAR